MKWRFEGEKRWSYCSRGVVIRERPEFGGVEASDQSSRAAGWQDDAVSDEGGSRGVADAAGSTEGGRNQR